MPVWSRSPHEAATQEPVASSHKVPGQACFTSDSWWDTFPPIATKTHSTVQHMQQSYARTLEAASTPGQAW